MSDPLAALGRVQEALDVLDGMTFYANAKMQITAVNLRVRLLAMTKRGDLALKQVHTLVERYPSDPLAFLALSDVHKHLNDNEQARAAARKALELIDPDRAKSVWMRILVAETLHAVGDWEACADAVAMVAGRRRTLCR